MSLILSGSDGVSDIDGSASTPAIRGTDANTGIFFPAADTIAFAEGGAEVMRIDSSGNVGIGTSSPGQRLEVSNSSTNTTFSTVGNQLLIRNSGSTTNAFARIDFAATTNNPNASIAAQFENNSTGATSILFGNVNTGTGSIVERARIDSSGNLLVGTTSTTVDPGVSIIPSGRINIGRSNNDAVAEFYRSGVRVGQINVTTTATSYITSSDYRLKENVQPMTGALDRVAALKPCTYKWKVDDSTGEGFIAHELQEVCPGAVAGEKDAVNEDGSIKPQGIDTSFLVATLTAAIQEQQQMIQTLQAKVAALEAKG